jgi:hypothetical protein
MPHQFILLRANVQKFCKCHRIRAAYKLRGQDRHENFSILKCNMGVGPSYVEIKYKNGIEFSLGDPLLGNGSFKDSAGLLC